MVPTLRRLPPISLIRVDGRIRHRLGFRRWHGPRLYTTAPASRGAGG